MNMTILFLLLLCIFLVVGLGINYSNIFTQTVINMKTPIYTSTPMEQTKYNQLDDYYLDANAAQGVFSNTVNLNNHILEPMVSGKNKLIPSANTDNWDRYKGPKGSVYDVKGENNKGFTFKGRNGKIFDLPLNNKTCEDSQYGCCPDNETYKNEDGSNCASSPVLAPPVGGCAGTEFGCCLDNVTAKNADGSNCASPVPSTPVGGCAGTQYGCCPDNVTAKMADGSNCASYPPNPLQPVGGCAGTQYGCCPDNVTAKMADGSNCASYPPPTPPSCSSSQYGCCLDGTTAKNADGSNCSTFNSWIYNGPNISGIAASGPNNSGYIIKGPNGNVYAGTASNCVISQYGCCPDMVTSKNANGSNCNYPVPPVPAPAPSPTNQTGCSVTQFGCCPDNVTAKNADGSNCSPANAWKYTGPNVTVYGITGQENSGFVAQGPQGNLFSGSTNSFIGGCAGTQYGCCPDNVTAKYADGSNCTSPVPTPVPVQVGGCAGTQYGCCPDNVTAKYADGSNCTSPEPVPALQTNGCAGTQYGCCPDNITSKNLDGSNCSSYPPPPVQTSTVFIPPPKGLLTVENNSYDTNSTYESVESKSENYNSKCPEPSPCPPCGRCPEPSFDCKKVPNYASTNSEYLPMPVLSDFSQFGM
jgi:hypothetical protein